jgi:hypothetical protein
MTESLQDEMLLAFESWEANLETPEEFATQDLAGITRGYTALAQEGDLSKLYEVASAVYGKSSEAASEQFLKVICKKDPQYEGSPGDLAHTKLTVHASAFSTQSFVSLANTDDLPSVATFKPARVLILSSKAFESLDRTFVRKLAQPPACWEAYSRELIARKKGSPCSLQPLQEHKSSKAVGNRRTKRGRSYTPDANDSEDDLPHGVNVKERALDKFKQNKVSTINFRTNSRSASAGFCLALLLPCWCLLVTFERRMEDGQLCSPGRLR